MSRLTVVILALVALLTAAASSLYLLKLQQPSLPVLEGLGGDFSLASTEGRDINLQEFRDKVILLNFGFTSCPDVCPTVLARMRSVLDALNDQASEIQPLFVTIDPERDSIDKLKTYLPFFHPSIIGLRGDSQQLKTVAALYKAFYQKQELDSALDYGFLHNDHIYLIDQQGRVRAMYSNSAKPATMVSEIRSLL